MGLAFLSILLGRGQERSQGTRHPSSSSGKGENGLWGWVRVWVCLVSRERVLGDAGDKTAEGPVAHRV